jgi:hypothetical protein
VYIIVAKLSTIIYNYYNRAFFISKRAFIGVLLISGAQIERKLTAKLWPWYRAILRLEFQVATFSLKAPAGLRSKE